MRLNLLPVIVDAPDQAKEAEGLAANENDESRKGGERA